jgi:hypothetical protein
LTPGSSSGAALEAPRRRNGTAIIMKIKTSIEFNITEDGLEDGLAEYDEITVEGLLREMLDKSIACDEIVVKVLEGPNTLEEYDQEPPEKAAYS